MTQYRTSLIVCFALMLNGAIGRATDLPHGLGIGTTESLSTAEQTAADMHFLRGSLVETAIDKTTQNEG